MFAFVPHVKRGIKKYGSGFSTAAGRSFASDERGVAVLVFALFIPIVLGFLGGAIDVGNTYRLKSKLQNSLDTAVLAAARAYEGGESKTKAQEIATAFIKANLGSELNVTTPTMTFEKADGSITVTADVSSTVDTFILKAFNVKTLPVAANSVAVVGREKFELVFVFDNSTSMDGTKISTLKAASKDLVNVFIPEANSDTARIGLVAFADYVNIGMGHRSEPGIDVPNDYSVTKTKTKWKNGKKVTKTYYHNYKWYGCAASRAAPLNTQDGSYDTIEAPGLMDTSDTCDAAPLVRLTNVKSTIESGITGMKAYGWTYIPAGLVWGWRVLSDGTPFADVDPNPEGYEIRKIMILMTDGANKCTVEKVTNDAAKEHAEGEIWRHKCHLNKTSWTTAANTVTSTLCTNIKNDDIMLFTIAFDVTDTSLKTLLKNCAGNGGSYHNASSNADLVNTFNSIAEKLTNLRLSK